MDQGKSSFSVTEEPPLDSLASPIELMIGPIESSVTPDTKIENATFVSNLSITLSLMLVMVAYTLYVRIRRR